MKKQEELDDGQNSDARLTRNGTKAESIVTLEYLLVRCFLFIIVRSISVVIITIITTIILTIIAINVIITIAAITMSSSS